MMEGKEEKNKRNPPRRQKDGRPVSKRQRRAKWDPSDPRFLLDNLGLTSFLIANGIRHVKPYPFEYKTFAKGRWIGRTILEVFSSEFKAYSTEYYKAALESGRVTVRDKVVGPHYKLNDGDWINHSTHRHEPPVSGQPIAVITETDDIVIINKPASIPIHATGVYTYNTILYILATEENRCLRTIHRLDRLTSGLVMFAKGPEIAAQMSALIRDGLIHKSYVARVAGKFPETKEESLLEVSEPVRVINPKLGLCACDPKGKHSLTKFQFVTYDKKTDTTLVRCFPITGRTHQIRLHLKHLGYPIANDPLYCDNPLSTTLFDVHEDLKQDADLMDGKLVEMLKNAEDANCDECQKLKENGYSDLIPPKEGLIWLHAFSYSYDDKWSYSVPLPRWWAEVLERNKESDAGSAKES